MSFQEDVLLNYVRKELNRGKTKIDIPAPILTGVSDEVLIEIRRLCKLNGVSVNINV
jgi:hypothetical protein